jgi:hypothetical protein
MNINGREINSTAGHIGAQEQAIFPDADTLDKSKSCTGRVPPLVLSADEKALCYKAIVKIVQETVSNNGANNLKAMQDSDFSLSPFASASSWLSAE